jgi:hypothetical protein
MIPKAEIQIPALIQLYNPIPRVPRTIKRFHIQQLPTTMIICWILRNDVRLFPDVSPTAPLTHITGKEYSLPVPHRSPATGKFYIGRICFVGTLSQDV